MGIAGTRPVTGAEYRALMSAFPTGVAVITAVDAGGRPHGMTCTSLTSVTVSPPVLLTCLDVRSGTLGAVLDGGAFAVNLLRAGSRHTAELFASVASDRFDRAAWRPSRLLGVPWLHADSFARAECAVKETVVVGDHVIVLGDVVSVDQERDVPLLYGLRGFAHWPGEMAP
ncbi:flavin reductase family protein [Nonomuraea sp. NPDC049714]|uniref:flavin reductase family protein n=1 Tax=unclassified Nonomuraea TaxID=2593643 RepID=UPI00378CD010